MRRSFVVLLLAFIAGSSPAVTAATIVRSTAMAERGSIDAICDVYNARPKLVRQIQLVRIAANGGLEAWRTVGDNGAPMDTDAVEFADVYSRDGKIVYATDTRSGAGGAREYCFANGKLVRASSSVVDTAKNVSRTRKLYFDTRGALFADTGLVVKDIEKRRNDLVPTDASPTVRIAIYSTPRKLPFYDAYHAAMEGRLPALR